MRSLICLVITGVFAGIAPIHAGPGRETANFKMRTIADKHESDVSIRVVGVVFSPRDIEVIRAHYGPQTTNLPPGLAKKVARGGQLPAGWQKKMAPFPPSLDRVLLPLPVGYQRGVYDGHAVVYHPITHAIYDIISLL